MGEADVSVRVMSRVWEHSQQSGTALLLLLALADFANDDGVAWPSVKTLAEKIRMSERYTQRLLAELVTAGEVRVEDQAAKHGTNSYTVIAGVNPSSPLNQSTPLNQSAQGGEPQFTGGVNPSSPEPSINHQEPSMTPAAAFYFKTFRRKRWANDVQRDLFDEIERDVGGEILLEAIRWAAAKNVSDLHAIKSAARKMKSGPKLPAKSTTNQPGQVNVPGPWRRGGT